MSDVPGILKYPPVVISTISDFVLGNALANSASATNVSQISTGTTAAFIPFVVAYPYTVNFVFWINGTSGTDSRDAGVYDFAGNKLISSGNTLTTGALQSVSVTPTTLPPGRYFLAISNSGVTNNYNASATGLNAMPKILGVLYKASSNPLPSQVVLSSTSALNSTIPLVGISSGSVV